MAFALVDCESFYASCERIFRPDLKNIPIVVPVSYTHLTLPTILLV